MARVQPSDGWEVSMFFRKRRQVALPQDPTPTQQQKAEPAWDDKTLEWIENSDRFEVLVTSVGRNFYFGHPDGRERLSKARYLWEISGIITYPKLIIVNIEFDVMEQFGSWFYNSYSYKRLGKNVSLPLIEIETANACGRQYTNVRIWKKKGDGMMTPADKEHGYDKRRPLFGVYVFTRAESSRLPKWACPLSSDRFDGIPDIAELSVWEHLN
jgi:hypothetical protein